MAGSLTEPLRELAADLADGWLIGASTLSEAGDKIEDMSERLEERGVAIQYAIPEWTYLDDTDEAAMEGLKSLLRDKPELYQPIVSKEFVGSPQTIAERITELSELGFDYIIFRISPAMKTLEKIGETLLPLLLMLTHPERN